ncbi:MAG: hypothetical protein WCO67_17290 [Betaproteobacteria bacterium]
MKHAVPKKGAHAARPIKTKRDHSGATAAAKRLAAQAAHDAEAEKRLQSLLHELDRFEDMGDEDEGDSSDGYDYSGPSRRWSDASDDA